MPKTRGCGWWLSSFSSWNRYRGQQARSCAACGTSDRKENREGAVALGLRCDSVSRTTVIARIQKGFSSMKMARATLKRDLPVLFGLIAFAAAGFSSTVPHSLWLMAQDGDRPIGKSSVNSGPPNSVADVHAPSSQAPKGLKPRQSKQLKTAESNSANQKPSQAKLALTGCKDHTPADGAAAIPGKTNVEE